ncbi:MAG: hypothetical protein LBS98_01735 [Coriobacteriales bacterium]|jgi:hypothetical protein|nr:hypothetical protein [Coriobacteriales bacterium]
MKTCSFCGSTAFDDMDICFGCLHSLDESVEELLIEEPHGNQGSLPTLPTLPTPPSPLTQQNQLSQLGLPTPPSPFASPNPSIQTSSTQEAPAMACLSVCFPRFFSYDVYLLKQEGAELSIGCATDNNIVIPDCEIGRHNLRLFYSQGSIWLEGKGCNQQVLIDDVPLTGTRNLKVGTEVLIGGACINLKEHPRD